MDRIYHTVLPILLGSLTGLALGLVGGGGSILTVPLLVGVLAVPAREATTMSLVIVGITALWGTIPHARRGHVLWGRAGLFGAVGLVGTLAGGTLNGAVSQQALLGGFVLVMLDRGDRDVAPSRCTIDRADGRIRPGFDRHRAPPPCPGGRRTWADRPHPGHAGHRVAGWSITVRSSRPPSAWGC